MNLKDILELIDKVADRGIAGVEIEQAGTKVRIEGKAAQPQVFHSFVGGGEIKAETPLLPSIPVSALPAAPPATSAHAVSESGASAAAPQPAGHVITSPIVGTFYRSPNPDAPSFVEVGSRVKKGQVICIIEAMKLMNEIESDVDGVVSEIYPQNAQPVEFGEPLFAIKV